MTYINCTFIIQYIFIFHIHTHIHVLLDVSVTSISHKWQPILLGFNSGYCGSCTTFATWQLVVGVHLLNGRWVDFITLSCLTFTTSYISLLAGIQLGTVIKRKFLGCKNMVSAVNSTASIEMQLHSDNTANHKKQNRYTPI